MSVLVKLVVLLASTATIASVQAAEVHCPVALQPWMGSSTLISNDGTLLQPYQFVISPLAVTNSTPTNATACYGSGYVSQFSATGYCLDYDSVQAAQPTTVTNFSAEDGNDGCLYNFTSPYSDSKVFTLLYIQCVPANETTTAFTVNPTFTTYTDPTTGATTTTLRGTSSAVCGPIGNVTNPAPAPTTTPAPTQTLNPDAYTVVTFTTALWEEQLEGAIWEALQTVTTTTATTTAAPLTTTSVQPTTTSANQTTAAPTTEGNVTSTAPAPTTASPTTEVPTTEAPTTAAPTTEAPTTAAPTTEAPTTAAPTTEAPTTAAPTTEAPTTAAPTTEAPTTAAPTTEAPTTAAPTTEAPTTAAPTTEAPTTAAPTTEAPTTAAPTTEAPTTAAPTTAAPTTEAPTTAAPTTAAPTTEAPTATETPTTATLPSAVARFFGRSSSDTVEPALSTLIIKCNRTDLTTYVHPCDVMFLFEADADKAVAFANDGGMGPAVYDAWVDRTPAPAPTYTTGTEGPKDDKMSDGEIAGIAVGCAAGLAIVVGIVTCAIRNRAKDDFEYHPLDRQARGTTYASV